MRIVGGRYRGLKLAPISGVAHSCRLRPTSVRARQSTFDILMHGRHGDLVAGKQVLDLFAGSGAMGLEALSRGAASAVFIDNSKAACALVAANIARAKFVPLPRIMRLDATALPDHKSPPFDLVFLDPPHGRGLAKKAIHSALSAGWLAAGAILVVEESTPVTSDPQFEIIAHRRVGNAHILISCLEM